MITSLVNRRAVLRGALGGGAVTVGLPLLDCFLNSNGTAFADGTPIPVRFGTWFWGMGMSSIFAPKKVGPDYDLSEENEALKDVKKHVNILTNYRVLTDGRPNICHYTGQVAIRCGKAPTARGDVPNESIDVTISDAVGDTSRFRSVQVAASGYPRHSYSFRSADAINAPEISPIALYQTMFGPDFQDPNAPTFTPNPKIMTRKSVLSAVLDKHRAMKNELGASDRERMDQYFTAVRELEGRLALQLQKPPPAEACSVPKTPTGEPVVSDAWETTRDRHQAMTDIMVWALACRQTRVYNMFYASGDETTKPGVPGTFHTVTHEELPDPKLGYQPTVSWFTRRVMESFAYHVAAFAAVKEGDGTLLDNMLIFAHSDQEYAKIHSINGIPMLTAGKAGGRIKTGIHVDGKGEATSRGGFTMLKAMGVAKSQWGSGSMEVNEPISEIYNA